jgi:tetratricopeptide (TPR) repeat protein
MREDVNNLDASMTPLDKQRQEVRDAADKAENAAESIPNTTTQEEVTELRKEAVDAAIDAYEKADMTDPPQAADVERAKEAAEQALAMDPNMTDEEREEAEELLEAIPTEEDAIREAFEESGLPEELFEEFKEGWDEYMESLMDGETSPSSPIKPPRPENPKTDVNQWLKRPEGNAAYYVDVTTGRIELLEDAPAYGSDLVMVAPFNTGELDRQGQPLVIPSVLEGVAEWWYQTGNRREDLIYEDSTTLRIQNGVGWDRPTPKTRGKIGSMRFFEVEIDGKDLIVRY